MPSFNSVKFISVQFGSVQFGSVQFNFSSVHFIAFYWIILYSRYLISEDTCRHTNPNGVGLYCVDCNYSVLFCLGCLWPSTRQGFLKPRAFNCGERALRVSYGGWGVHVSYYSLWRQQSQSILREGICTVINHCDRSQLCSMLLWFHIYVLNVFCSSAHVYFIPPSTLSNWRVRVILLTAGWGYWRVFEYKRRRYSNQNQITSNFI